MSDEESVVRLPVEHEPAPEPSPTPPTRMHGMAIAGMAACALVGILGMLAFVTVNWPGSVSRFIVGAIVIAGVGFLACASAAVLTAARDTYAHGPSGRE